MAPYSLSTINGVPPTGVRSTRTERAFGKSASEILRGWGGRRGRPGTGGLFLELGVYIRRLWEASSGVKAPGLRSGPAPPPTLPSCSLPWGGAPAGSHDAMMRELPGRPAEGKLWGYLGVPQACNSPAKETPAFRGSALTDVLFIIFTRAVAWAGKSLGRRNKSCFQTSLGQRPP